MFIGLDIGSVSVNAVLMDEEKGILEDHYERTMGQPIQAMRRVLADMLSRTPAAQVRGLAVTGSGGKLASEIMGWPFINEIIAQSKATALLHPEVRTVIEIGGEDSKLILLERDEASGQVRVRDFAMNTLCAAGTGSFLDQQASRLGFTIEEFSQTALKSQNPPRIAGRCSVFAKTDMIHLQQEATPDYDIIAGLCHAMARNFRSNIAKGKEFEKPVAFHGGVAANAGMIRAFECVLEMPAGELLVPDHFASMGAIGAVLSAMESGKFVGLAGLEAIDAHLAKRGGQRETLDPLKDSGHTIDVAARPPKPGEKLNAFIGVDVGSISTNVIVLAEDGRVLARRYLMTAGRPLEAVVRGLKEVGEEIADQVVVKGCATTGSGRYLTGDFIGADVAKNEITAHATGAAWINPEVDTIFEIGGQDSKYVYLEHGAVVDFTMNKVCAAGTGSFLEEQAERLGVKIIDEFGQMALGSKSPAHLGERCTVFMESDLNHHQQQGVPKQDLVAGLCYSIVYNYLNRVVEDRPIGNCILFQGGVAGNRGVVAAFERVTGKKIIVPPHHDCMGAIGAALIARQEVRGPSRFKGFDLTHRKYTVDAFECKDCPNLCEVRRVSVGDETALTYGSRCGKFDEEKKVSLGEHLPRLFREREKLLTTAYAKAKPDQPNGRKVGIPRVAHYFELFPFWKAFFTECGFEVVTSGETNRRILNEGLEHVVSETCFPIKAAHGHVLELIRRGVDYLFLPSTINMPPLLPGAKRSYNCPYIQCLPYLLDAAMEFDHIDMYRQDSAGSRQDGGGTASVPLASDCRQDGGGTTRILSPTIHMERGQGEVDKVFVSLAAELGVPRDHARRALTAAWDAQRAFYAAIERRGQEILDGLKEGDLAIVMVSRPYNGCDTGLNLNLPEKLRDLGVLAIPPDFIPIDPTEIAHEYPNMYWRYGQRLVALGRAIASDSRLHALYLTNFGCGPDSFISKYFTREMRGKPYLTIEVDEHSADVGAITRCEAFLDSIRNVETPKKAKKPTLPLAHVQRCRTGTTVYVPYMDDHQRPIAAAMRFHGVEAVPLPMSDLESVSLGRQHTSGKECFPCIVTTGDILKTVRAPGFDPSRSAFFMPSAMGPCRFGQYSKFHRMLLDDLGYSQVPIVELDQASVEGYHGDLGNLGTRFRKHAWSGIVLTDLLQKACRQTRPYERTKGDSDALYAHYLARVESAVERGEDLLPLAREIATAYAGVGVDRREPKPRIGIVGEIYVRCNPYCNNFICQKLEALGAEVVLPPLEEWVDYIGQERRTDSWDARDWKGWLIEVATSFVQDREVRRITRPFRGVVRDFLHESSTPEIVRLANPYLDFAIRGEAILSMGRSVEYAHHGFDGIVNVIPFNCMPGTIVDALLERYRRTYPRMPILKMAYDGLQHVGEDTRIEAFMFQAQQHATAAPEPEQAAHN